MLFTLIAIMLYAHDVEILKKNFPTLESCEQAKTVFVSQFHVWQQPSVECVEN